MLQEKNSKTFTNGSVHLLRTEDNYPLEVTDTFLPFYTKDAIGRKQNMLDSYDLGDRSQRWLIGVSCMSGCPVRCKFCLVPSSKILLSDFTTKNIEDITLNDNVLSNVLTTASNEITSYASKYYKSNKVTELFKRKYIGKIIKITTSDKNIIELTPNHRIATETNSYRNKFIRADTLAVGDKIYTVSTLSEPNLSYTDEWIIGWLHGFIQGDSVYTKNTNRHSYKTTVSQSNDLIYYAHKMINKYFGKTTQVSDYNDGINTHKISHTFSFGEATYINMQSVISNNKDSIMFKKGYIAGFWDAEGFAFKNNKTVRVCNTNIDFLNTFNNYLVDIGFKKGRIKQYKSLGTCLILETNISRMKFNLTFYPLHDKKLFLNHVDKIKNVCNTSTISVIESYDYDGYVYNFATETHTYIANNVLAHNCATGQLKKCRNLTWEEIVAQVMFVVDKNGLNPQDSKEFKINYTRMGEPFLNIDNVRKAIEQIDKMYPNAHHYISTIGVAGSDYSWIKGNITLQLSLHSLVEEKRNWLIPFKHKMSIKELGQVRTNSNLKTTVNMTLVDENDFDIEELSKNFHPDNFFIKISPINENCISKENSLGQGVITGINLV